MTTLPETIRRLADAGALAPLDVHLAEMLGRRSGCTDADALLGVAVASHAVGVGHVCADLAAVTSEPAHAADGSLVEDVPWPPLERWKEALRAAPFVSDGPGPLPLVLDGDRLYLSRYCEYERRVAAAITRRVGSAAPPFDADLAASGIAALFPDREGREAAQARAALATLGATLTVISGGPGTGKTTTVARILALLIQQELAAGRTAPLIELLAPTGKAAQRLGESISGAVGTMDVAPEVLDAIPREAATIHRRLGFRFDDPTRFRHDATNPLDAAVVVVDEASMVDLALMAKLIEAVPLGARLVLLGDRDQLASVEAGAIFGDICIIGERPGSTLHPVTVQLTERFRFGDDSPVPALADLIRTGDADAAVDLLYGGEPPRTAPTSPATPDLFEAAAATPPPASSGFVHGVPPREANPFGAVAGAVIEGYRELLTATTPERALEGAAQFRVLCAHRRGLFGVDAVGPAIERLLEREGLVKRPRRASRSDDGWYPGRLVMVTENDYQLELFNGDVGVALPAAGDPDRLRVYFAGPGGAVRDVQPARLPAHETCFAMTIHKSQGSEFDTVAVVLPDQPSPILSRELLYTGLTRARSSAWVVGTQDVVRRAIERRVLRTSGLADLL
jgi:exodeoxyribonuclease V alpha subunit